MDTKNNSFENTDIRFLKSKKTPIDQLMKTVRENQPLETNTRGEGFTVGQTIFSIEDYKNDANKVLKRIFDK